jgi:anti-anti-sigma factor
MDLEPPLEPKAEHAAPAPVSPGTDASGQRPGMDLEPPIPPKEDRAASAARAAADSDRFTTPVSPTSDTSALRPGMDLEPPIPPKEPRAPIIAPRAAPGARKPDRTESSNPAPSAPGSAAPGSAAPGPAAPKPAAPGPAAAGSGSAASPSARFTDTMCGGVHVIAFTRSEVVDADYIKRVGDDIYRHLKGSGQPKVVIDLANVRFMSSVALGMLTALRTVVVDKMKGGICIGNVDDSIKDVFRVTKLHKVLKIHDDTDSAIRSLILV